MKCWRLGKRNMGKTKNSGWKHRLSNIDLEDLIADCKSCGPQVKIVNADRIRCARGRKKGGVYGETKLSYDEREALFKITHCPICERELVFEESTLDHCHETHVIRGFLCHNCNLGLGKFRDEIDSLERAIDYLKGKIGRIKYGEV